MVKGPAASAVVPAAVRAMLAGEVAGDEDLADVVGVVVDVAGLVDLVDVAARSGGVVRSDGPAAGSRPTCRRLMMLPIGSSDACPRTGSSAHLR